jgi:hypothetical protein
MASEAKQSVPSKPKAKKARMFFFEKKAPRLGNQKTFANF